MITITKLEQQFKPDNTPSGFKVNLSDGSWGYLVEKNSDKGLKEGDEVTFTSETPTGKSYKKLTIRKAGTPTPQPLGGQQLITPQPPQKPLIHVGAGKTKEELKADASISMASACLQAVKEDKLDFGQVAEKQKFMTKLLWEEIDEIFSNKV